MELAKDYKYKVYAEFGLFKNVSDIYFMGGIAVTFIILFILLDKKSHKFRRR